jgi:hypothetical protein
MTKTGTILKAMQTVLLVTVLTPAPSFAEPALTARQMLAQAQTQSQDNAVKGEVKKITSRGLIMTDAQAAESTNPNGQRPVVIPAVSAPLVSAPVAPAPVVVAKVDTPAPTPSTTEKVSTFEVAAAPVTPAPQARIATSSIVILPAPPVAANSTTPESVTKTDTATPTVATVPAQPSVTETTIAAPASSLPVVAATSDTANDAPKANHATATVAPATKKAVASTETVAMHSSSRHLRRSHPDNVFEISSANVGSQLKHILNRPEVRTLLAQYGLN